MHNFQKGMIKQNSKIILTILKCLMIKMNSSSSNNNNNGEDEENDTND